MLLSNHNILANEPQESQENEESQGLPHGTGPRQNTREAGEGSGGKDGPGLLEAHCSSLWMESWPQLAKLPGVYKSVLPRRRLETDTQILSFFSLFAVLKNKLFFLLCNGIGSKSSTVNSNPKKKSTRSKIFPVWQVAQGNSMLFTWCEQNSPGDKKLIP